MHVGIILDLHHFMRRLYEAPKLTLDVMLCHTDITKHVHCGVFFARAVLFRGMRLKPPSTELAITCLKTRQNVPPPRRNQNLPSPEYTSWAEPLPMRHS
jgi:hypothetical protein